MHTLHIELCVLTAFFYTVAREDEVSAKEERNVSVTFGKQPGRRDWLGKFRLARVCEWRRACDDRGW
jgi:hypothetical protein